jgi:hypothetical protein
LGNGVVETGVSGVVAGCAANAVDAMQRPAATSRRKLIFMSWLAIDPES